MVFDQNCVVDASTIYISIYLAHFIRSHEETVKLLNLNYISISWEQKFFLFVRLLIAVLYNFERYLIKNHQGKLCEVISKRRVL